MIACGEQSWNVTSPLASFPPYIKTARGRPASRRIPSPPGCLPRVTLGRAAVDGMSGEKALPGNGLHLPDDVYGKARSFSIDAEIKALASAKGRSISLASCWAELDAGAAIYVGRRALDRGYHAALGPHDERQKGDWIDQWRAGEDAASEARDALRKLLRFMSPADSSLNDIALLAEPLRQQVRQAEPTLGFKMQMEEARRRAGIVLEAWQIIETLPGFMARNRQEVAASRTNPGDPEKAAFVFQIGVAWALLTKRKPGQSPVPEANPFYRMVRAAWTDVGGEETSFESAIRTLDAEAVLEQAAATSLADF